MAASELVAAYEARSSSTHSSPSQATRDVLTADQIQKKPKEFVLVTVFSDKDGTSCKTETPVRPSLMRYDGEHKDHMNGEIKWQHFEYEGSDARLIGRYFLYAIRGNSFYCRHVSLMGEYRLKWMFAGP